MNVSALNDVRDCTLINGTTLNRKSPLNLLWWVFSPDTLQREVLRISLSDYELRDKLHLMANKQRINQNGIQLTKREARNKQSNSSNSINRNCTLHLGFAIRINCAIYICDHVGIDSWMGSEKSDLIVVGIEPNNFILWFESVEWFWNFRNLFLLVRILRVSWLFFYIIDELFT